LKRQNFVIVEHKRDTQWDFIEVVLCVLCVSLVLASLNCVCFSLSLCVFVKDQNEREGDV